jgi:hypothetical protein
MVKFNIGRTKRHRDPTQWATMRRIPNDGRPPDTAKQLLKEGKKQSVSNKKGRKAQIISSDSDDTGSTGENGLSHKSTSIPPNDHMAASKAKNKGSQGASSAMNSPAKSDPTSKLSVKSSAKSPTKAPLHHSLKAPAKSSTNTPSRSSVKTPTQSPAKKLVMAKGKMPAQPPALPSVNLPDNVKPEYYGVPWESNSCWFDTGIEMVAVSALHLPEAFAQCFANAPKDSPFQLVGELVKSINAPLRGTREDKVKWLGWHRNVVRHQLSLRLTVPGDYKGQRHYRTGFESLMVRHTSVISLLSLLLRIGSIPFSIFWDHIERSWSSH